MSTETRAIADDQVRSAFQRWKNLEEEKARIGDDLKELFAEQKAFGHDTKAMRAAFRLKVKIDEASPEDAEHEALVDTYLAALEAPRASRAYARENIGGFDRKARAAVRTSEAMDDNKAFSAELVAAGLISEEAHAENVAISDAVARKYGAGVLDARRSDGGLSIFTKHEDIRTSDGSPSVSSSLATREPEESVVPHLPVTAEELQHPVPHATGANARSGGDGSTVRGARTEADAVTAGETAPQFPSDDGAIAAVNGKAGLANADGVEPPSSVRQADQPIDGGSNEVATDNDFPAVVPTSVTGEGAANTALPADGIVMEYVPQSGVKRLPFASCFPDHSKAEYERLEKDIAANRVQTPIIRQGDVIVDGFARYTIARKYGFSYPVQEYTGSDVLLDVIEWQRASRNFTPAQEKKIAADLAKELPHRADDIMAAFGLAEALEAAE